MREGGLGRDRGGPRRRARGGRRHGRGERRDRRGRARRRRLGRGGLRRRAGVGTSAGRGRVGPGCGRRRQTPPRGGRPGQQGRWPVSSSDSASATRAATSAAGAPPRVPPMPQCGPVRCRARARRPAPEAHAAPAHEGERLLDDHAIDSAVSDLENTATPTGKGLQSPRRVSADIDEPLAISNQGAWDDPANKRFLERFTNQQTKGGRVQYGPPAPHATISLRQAKAAGPGGVQGGGREADDGLRLRRDRGAGGDHAAGQGGDEEPQSPDAQVGQRDQRLDPQADRARRAHGGAPRPRGARVARLRSADHLNGAASDAEYGCFGSVGGCSSCATGRRAARDGSDGRVPGRAGPAPQS